jgi:endoglucanase
MKLFRVPVLWERLQPTLGAALDTDYAAQLDTIVNRIMADDDAVFVFDPHNYGKFNEDTIQLSGGAVDAADLADLLVRVADRYSAYWDRIWMGQMNEPNIQTPTQWRDIALTVEGIQRSEGFTGKVLVTGSSYSSVGLWVSQGNAAAWAGQLPANCLIEQHLYYTASGNGGSSDKDTAMPGIGRTRMIGFRNWCRDEGVQGYMGEIGTGNTAAMRLEIEASMNFMSDNRDVFAGWSAWLAGSGVSGGNTYSLQPTGTLPDAAVDRDQMRWLAPYL